MITKKSRRGWVPLEILKHRKLPSWNYRPKDMSVTLIYRLRQKMAGKGYKEAEGWLSNIKERIGYWQKEEKQRKIAAPFN